MLEDLVKLGLFRRVRDNVADRAIDLFRKVIKEIANLRRQGKVSEETLEELIERVIDAANGIVLTKIIVSMRRESETATVLELGFQQA